MADPYINDADFTLYVGDALGVLRGLPDESVDCVVTSPPYWGLRDYGTGEWEGGDEGCDHADAKVKVRADYGFSEAAQVQTSNVSAGYTRYKDECPCGARRVDQQLGLEPTPDVYVTRMVEVFREVRRVLARHGTCWVNLGDSYAGSGKGGQSDEKRSENWQPTYGPPSHGGLLSKGVTGRTATDGRPSPFESKYLKPKDLAGMPWRVAFALQQPYYTGRIKDERDRIWLAAMVDAEGCIHIHRRKAGTDSGAKFTKKDGTEVSYARTKDTYGVMVSIDNTSEAVIDRCHAIFGQGSRYTHEKGTGKQQRKQTLYRWTVTGNQARELLRELYPHLVAKQQEARIAYSSPSSGDAAAQAHEAIKLLHNGSPTTVDAQAPPSLLEAGWFLRSDIVWSKKPNPMPESVTDRPTKAHEYVFLLTKQQRYYFDAEAVREPHSSTRWGGPVAKNTDDWKYRNGGDLVGTRERDGREFYPNGGRNIRSVWEIATQPYPEAHFATFPEELARRCILAGCPERVCRVCGKPSERITSTDYENPGNRRNNGRRDGDFSDATVKVMSGGQRLEKRVTTEGWSDCGHNQYRPGVVLDPFLGSGTTALVARNHGRHAIGIELSPEYAELAAKRTRQLSLLAT